MINDIIYNLSASGEEEKALFEKAANVKSNSVGKIVYLRGLIELSNICEKDCFYCGIRKSNRANNRYDLSQEEVIELVRKAYSLGYGSVAIQSGEVSTKSFIEKINNIVSESKKITNNEIGITLSCGEQSEETYLKWFESGADRYLLRIETSSENLYKKLHPKNNIHCFANRIKALEAIKKTNYQVGTGVMIGLPFQTLQDLANDLNFMREFDIDMCGMGPYIEHTNTPLYNHRGLLLPMSERLKLGIKMIALLRISMSDINIAATTAMQTIDKEGRIKAILAGANVLMPNITPEKHKMDYILYDNMPIYSRSDEDELTALDQQMDSIAHKIAYFNQGNAIHYTSRL